MELISSAPALGQPYIAPPGVPADRLAILRHAFDATLRDTAFLGDAEKIHFELRPIDAAETSRIVQRTINTPAELVARAKAALGAPDR
jgi:hypothetical protein